MATQFVVGLFTSSGIALDAYHRLRTEGFPPGQLAHRVLKEVGPPSSKCWRWIRWCLATLYQPLTIETMALREANSLQ
jgi:hypothetical protein